jgi:hypothetical protein
MEAKSAVSPRARSRRTARATMPTRMSTVIATTSRAAPMKPMPSATMVVELRDTSEVRVAGGVVCTGCGWCVWEGRPDSSGGMVALSRRENQDGEAREREVER